MTVYKIGGSLLDLPRLADLARYLLARQPPGQALFVIGGGAPADAVREWDQAHHLGEAAAHQLALEAMELTRQLWSRLLPELRPIRSLRQAIMARQDNVPGVLCASCFIKAFEAGGEFPLEHSWRVTSDSIAAWAAHVVGAAELVLVKSVPVPRAVSLEEASRAELVDQAFPEIARRLPAVGWLNGRSEPWEVAEWIAGEPQSR